MSERSYLSIGEVLALLKEEFTDITISKIRFLESQGLIDPERTPSGYRKFYDADVERLRWILRQQKEHFLPLRVIRGKLADGEPDEDLTGDEPDASHPALSPVPDPEPSPEEAEEPEPREAVVTALTAGKRTAPPFPASLRRSASEAAPTEDDDTEAEAERTARRTARPMQRTARHSQSRTSPAAFLTAPDDGTQERGRRAVERPAAAARPAPPAEAEAGDEAEMTADELAAAAGLSSQQVADLERYGLLAGQPGPGGRYYDTTDLQVARVAAAFAGFGVEARHLKMWRQAAEREAAFYDQVVIPLRKQRNPAARKQAADTQAELARLGLRLHALLVQTALDNPKR